VSAIVVALFGYGMPVQMAIMATLMGAAYGVFPIAWIVFASIMLYRLAVDTGKFEVIKDSVGSLTDDRRLQAMLVAGTILLEVGLLDEAAAAFTEALEILSRTASRWSRADCLIHAGVCDLRRGHAGGLALIDEALAEARRLGARYLEATALIARAGAHLRRGALPAAIDDAAEGTAIAHAVTLTGHEIQGLARHALALTRFGERAGAAPALAQRALALFDDQRYLEGSEEEILAGCAEVLRAAGAGERARAVLERARASAHRKLDALTDPAWRAAFLATPPIRELLA
jgi:tetratricopeptide (TPR) repeat protein